MNIDITQAICAIPTMNLGNEIAAQIMKMSLDNMETAGEGIKKMMEMSVNPSLGSNIDVCI
ncbi:MAG: YjfB family protein [Clostridium sp.]|nr:YjfB family protein [Clostridium sp.]